MSRTFDVVQSLSGQKNVITIPRPYLAFFKGKGEQNAYALAAVLNQIVFWSGCDSSCDDGWFYKSHEEMGNDLEVLSADQIQRIVTKLCRHYFPDCIEYKTRKVNGTPTAHYRVNGEALIAKIFPSSLDSAESRNGKREIAESNPQNRGMENAESQNGNREVAESYLYTDQDIQINTPVGQSDKPTDAPAEGTLKIDYQAVLEAYHTTLPELPAVLKMTDDRRKTLRKLWKDYDMTVEKWGAYLRYISKKCRWMLEDRPDSNTGKTWRRKDFDYLITEKCYLKVKEERANDLPKVQRLDGAARDDAFLRLIAQRQKPQNEVERLAVAKAGAIGRMNEYDARRAWSGIWSQAVTQASENDLARIGS